MALRILTGYNVVSNINTTLLTSSSFYIVQNDCRSSLCTNWFLYRHHIVPLVKDKSRNLNDMANYRPRSMGHRNNPSTVYCFKVV